MAQQKQKKKKKKKERRKKPSATAMQDAPSGPEQMPKAPKAAKYLVQSVQPATDTGRCKSQKECPENLPPKSIVFVLIRPHKSVMET